jgi:hypothetical protein
MQPVHTADVGLEMAKAAGGIVVAAATTILLYIPFLKSEAMCCY